MIDVDSFRTALDISDVARHYGIEVKHNKCLCPFHSERTASCHIEKEYFKCFGCGAGGDVIKFVQLLFGLSFYDAVNKIADDFSVGAEHRRKQSAQEVIQAQRTARQRELWRKKETAARMASAADYTQYYRKCREGLFNPLAHDYLSKRGISIETAKRFWIGFDENADPARSGHKCPRIIIPVSKCFFIGRSVDPSTEKKYQKMNSKGSSPDIFNQKVIWSQTQPVFVVEGVFDALSVEEVGGTAVSLNSASNASLLLKLVTEKRPAAPIIICLDADDAGQTGSTMLVRGLSQLGIPFSLADICCGEKDPNDALVRWRDDFAGAVHRAIERW